MLDIDIEFKKGILFVRLTGILNKVTVSKLNNEVTDMVRDNGIRNIVFNISQIISIDIKGINALLYNYELCTQNKGNILLCGLINDGIRKKIAHSRLLKYIDETTDELSAYNYIKI